MQFLFCAHLIKEVIGKVYLDLIYIAVYIVVYIVIYIVIYIL